MTLTSGTAPAVPHLSFKSNQEPGGRAGLFHFRRPNMPIFTIETTYHLPVYRQRSYEADAVEQACRLAIEDDDWTDEKLDHETAGETYVSGIWEGPDAAYAAPPIPVPSQYGDLLPRKADHFEVLLGIVKVLARDGESGTLDRAFWQTRAAAAIAKAEAILAAARDPD
jgi:hypothetical protein